jgi:hypothetical protein
MCPWWFSIECNHLKYKSVFLCQQSLVVSVSVVCFERWSKVLAKADRLPQIGFGSWFIYSVGCSRVDFSILSSVVLSVPANNHTHSTNYHRGGVWGNRSVSGVRTKLHKLSMPIYPLCCCVLRIPDDDEQQQATAIVDYYDYGYGFGAFCLLWKQKNCRIMFWVLFCVLFLLSYVCFLFFLWVVVIVIEQPWHP